MAMTTDMLHTHDTFKMAGTILDGVVQLKQSIAELEAENAALKESQRWRKFPDEKPKWGEEVIILDKDGDHHIVRFSHDMKWISWGKMNTCESDCVKFWMPFPKAPEEGT